MLQCSFRCFRLLSQIDVALQAKTLPFCNINLQAAHHHDAAKLGSNPTPGGWNFE